MLCVCYKTGLYNLAFTIHGKRRKKVVKRLDQERNKSGKRLGKEGNKYCIISVDNELVSPKRSPFSP